MKHSEVTSLVGRAVEAINSDVSRKLTARLASEKPPLDARHVTDTRTRVSTLLEYALGYELNRLLAKNGAGHSVTAVLWNSFPDLLVRDATHTPVAGLEVKALHTAAEEKSANLATPMHSIRKGGDFLVILIWAWRRDDRNAEIVYPRIIETGIFDAYLLAQIRDYSWLHNTGGRMKAFDVSTPLISSEKRKGFFKAEEGNMGKLMRIALDEELPETTPKIADLRNEAARYKQFQSRVLMHGATETFREICEVIGATKIVEDEQKSGESYPATPALLAEATLANGARFLLIAGGTVAQFMRDKSNSFPETTVALHLSVKLVWQILRRKKGAWENIAKGEKPDAVFEKIKNAIMSPK